MKLEVGQFVRTKSGIDKIIEIKEANKELDRYHIVTENNEMAFGYLAINKTIFVKDQLIDLIEVGDYVNGEKVYLIDGTMVVYLGSGANDLGYKENEIKSILTHEMFEANCYKVVE